ncbi:hypothetical protein BDZ94DRAFT_1239046 [Collybia nuda]|uniref:Zn(2)-C6 fungal-type domain-containing protein n=1 Tax=Collybia nuda TaxID=64659 RepID=A0A9P6CBM4_9AGAR|nr:hypothetical protein BDZ94DRAFT_1239046 [Collybia nuda]
MSTEQPKTAPSAQEHTFPPPTVAYTAQHFNGSYPPPGPPGAYPPYFAYPPPPEGTNGENGQNGAPPGPQYMMFPPPPPGMVFAYNPTQGPGFNAPPTPQSLPALRPKRKQVKMACTNCAAACKRCDEHRPCERCTKYGVADTCKDGQRKERKKGIKRGPYKRKNKGGPNDSPSYGDRDAEAPAGGEWATPTPGGTAAAIQAVAHQFPPSEGYYPMFYPPHGQYIPPPPEGQPGQEGSHGNGQPPMMPYYIHPGSYPPGTYPPYPHFSMYPPGGPPPQQPPHPNSHPPPIQAIETVDPKAPKTINGNNAVENGDVKKRPRTSKGAESKAKKAKGTRATRVKDGDATGENEVEGE